MKILGENRGETFIVEMTKYELTYLQNSSYPHMVKMGVGATVEIDKAWYDLKAFQAAAGNIEAATKTLQAVAELATAARANYIINPEPTPENEAK